MKISNTFPILSKINALFIVAGKQTAIIYRLKNGQINERDTIEILTPTYSDNEGRFESHGPRGRLQGSGASYTSDMEYISHKFLDSIVDSLKKINTSYSAIYLFAPSRVIKDIQSVLTSADAEKVVQTFIGNFTKQHPTELLAKVKELRDFKTKAIARSRVGGDAATILRRGRRIAKHIGKRKTIR